MKILKKLKENGKVDFYFCGINKAPLKNHSKNMLRFSWTLIEQTRVEDK